MILSILVRGNYTSTRYVWTSTVITKQRTSPISRYSPQHAPPCRIKALRVRRGDVFGGGLWSVRYKSAETGTPGHTHTTTRTYYTYLGIRVGISALMAEDS